jgi:hypothetical protein
VIRDLINSQENPLYPQKQNIGYHLLAWISKGFKEVTSVDFKVLKGKVKNDSKMSKYTSIMKSLCNKEINACKN